MHGERISLAFFIVFSVFFCPLFSVKSLQKWHHPSWRFYADNSIILFTFFFHIKSYEKDLKHVTAAKLFFVLSLFKSSFYFKLDFFAGLLASNRPIAASSDNLFHNTRTYVPGSIDTFD